VPDPPVANSANLNYVPAIATTGNVLTCCIYSVPVTIVSDSITGVAVSMNV
jgi:hypothetical protein